MTELKRLTIVEATSRRTIELSENVYRSVRQQAVSISPAFVEKYVGQVECFVQPWYNSFVNISFSALSSVDNTVDDGIALATNAVSNGLNATKSVVGEKRVHAAVSAKDTVVDHVTGAYSFYQHNGVVGTKDKAIETMRATVERSYQSVLSTASAVSTSVKNAGLSSWEWATNTALGKRAKDAGAAYAGAAKSRYMAVHERVVDSDRYALLYSSLLHKWNMYVAGNATVAGTFSKARSSVYPYVKFAADPLAEVTTPYISALRQHLAPTHMPRAADAGMPATAADEAHADEASAE